MGLVNFFHGGNVKRIIHVGDFGDTETGNSIRIDVEVDGDKKRCS